MNPRRALALEAFDRLLTIMDELREGCPWDREQTLESLRHLTIEETYELADAILDGDLSELKKEVGDVLLHLVFYSRIASETAAFDIADVLIALNEKLVRRHPHIYGDTQVADTQAVKENWEKIKLGEGKRSVLEGVPRSLPALVKAYRIQDKAKGVGFDWMSEAEVFEKVLEEQTELREALSSGNRDEIEAEMGDVLFSWVNYARWIGVEPDAALERTNKKFIERFKKMEAMADAESKALHELDFDALNLLWDRAKREL